MDDESYGDPENPLRWTTRSLRNLADALRGQGFTVSHEKVGQLLEEQGFSLQKNQKKPQVGKGHSDRDAQSRHINRRVRKLQAEGCPVVSVDRKKTTRWVRSTSSCTGGTVTGTTSSGPARSWRWTTLRSLRKRPQRASF